MKATRLYFIDAVRAFAILMMLQGHFIHTLLDVQYRDSTNIVYSTWEYFRGITAPLFFTISGLIFTYLLIRAKDFGKSGKRVRKGLKRGFMLIGIGYLLRISILEWIYDGRISNYFWIVDVLQCIGLSILLIIIIYKLTSKNSIVFQIIIFCIGVGIFITEPLYRNLELNHIPIIISNYVSKANGSIFTITPWFGYMAFGSFLASLFYKYAHIKNFKIITISLLIILGFGFIHLSNPLLFQLYYISDIELFKNVANYNYLFSRLGDVFILLAVFYSLEVFIKKFAIILKIGQSTLSIYVIHFIVLYGSFTGFGLYQILGKSLNPWQAIIGALLFLILISFLSLNYKKVLRLIFKKTS